MSYPYPRLLLDIRLAKKRLEKVLDPACGVADGTTDGPRLAETCPTEACLTELFYAVSKQEPTRAVFWGVAIERIVLLPADQLLSRRIRRATRDKCAS